MVNQIGKYKVEKELGQGGFGKVYLAFDPDVGQRVAIKKILSEGDPDLLKRFLLEIRTTASLRHKNIVSIYASGEEAGDPYLVMEFLEGLTLKQIIHEGRRPLTLLDKVRIISQVADGLGYANSKGVVHRDVKPENIMVLPDDNVKIMDFGIALGPSRNTAVTQTGGIIGTPPYFAPEQLQGYKANEQTDIFSFGDVCYELLTGVHPFERYKSDWKSLQIAIMSYQPRSIGELVPGCPEALESLVHRALAKEPEFRYQNFKEVQLDSEAILVDLRHEGADAILREIPSLTATGNITTALTKINQAYQLDPGNREVRRLREEISMQMQKETVQTRVSKVLAEAEKFMSDQRYAEAVGSLEFAARLDTTNVTLVARLEEAKARQERYLKANRLVSEARFLQQKGQLPDADDRLQQALTLDPDHTEAKRLHHRIGEDLGKRRFDSQLQQAIQAAQDHRAARRFVEALAILDALEKESPGAAGAAGLRAEIQKEQADAEERRERAARFNLALAKARETVQAGDTERARSMVSRLDANFGSDPAAAEVLRELRGQLEAQGRAAEIAQYEQRVRALLKEKSFRAALDALTEARARFPGEGGLERLNKQAEDSLRAHQRSQAVGAVLRAATAKRDAGDLQGALDAISKGRRELGDEAAFGDLARQLEIAIDRHRQGAELEKLLKDGRDLMATGSYSVTIERLEKAPEFGGDTQVRALLASARAAAAVEEERRFAEGILSAAAELQAHGELTQALSAVERGLARYPKNPSLAQLADGLRDSVNRNASIERYRTAIGLEVRNRDWDRADAALRQAYVEFPGDPAFDELARQIQPGRYEDGWRQLEGRVNRDLAANTVSRAEENLRDQATVALYADDPRWKTLSEGVARRRGYEDALSEANRQLNAGHLSQAEDLLTEVIKQGTPDKRADQMRSAIQVRRSEALRQQEIARIAQRIRERLAVGDVAQAGSDLAAARSRYPGESAWTGLQLELDAQQQSLRRQAEIAAAAENVRQALARDDPRQAWAALVAARAKYPGEVAWPGLEREVMACQALLKRKDEIVAAAGGIRRWLNRDLAGDLKTVPIAGRPEHLLQLRRHDWRPAITELAAARAKYAGESVWDTVQAEIDAFRAFLDREGEIAEGLIRCLESGDLAAAQSQLAAARAECPDEILWSTFQAEIGRRQEVARITAAVREQVAGGDVSGARTELALALAKDPQESIWAVLFAEIEERQAEIDRKAGIAAAAEAIRARLDRGIRDAWAAKVVAPAGTCPIVPVWDVLQDAAAQLIQALGRYHGEPLWQTLAAEITERQIQVQYEIVDAVRSSPDLIALDGNTEQVAAARTRYPDEPFWASIEAEIDARREPLERASIAQFESRVGDSLKLGDLPAALAVLNAARTLHPGVPSWDRLQGEIDAQQALWQRRQELDAVDRGVREQLQRVVQLQKEPERIDPFVLQWEAFNKAAAIVAEARAKYPFEDRLAVLQTQTGARRAQWQQELGQSILDLLRSAPGHGVDGFIGNQIRTLRQKDPGEPLWGRLVAEIDAREALLQRAAEVAEAGKRVREYLQEEDVRQAAVQVDAGRAKFGDDPLWPALVDEIRARRAEIEEAFSRAGALLAEQRPAEAIALIEHRRTREVRFAELLTRAHRVLEDQRRREARDRTRDRLLAIEEQAGTETRKKKRKELESEAQRLAASYLEDPEIAAIAARILTPVEAPAEPVAPAPAAKKPIPWMLVLIVVGALVVAAVVFLLLHKT